MQMARAIHLSQQGHHTPRLGKLDDNHNNIQMQKAL